MWIFEKVFMEIYFLGLSSISGSHAGYSVRTDGISHFSYSMNSTFCSTFSIYIHQFECFQVDFEVVFDILDILL